MIIGNVEVTGPTPVSSLRKGKAFEEYNSLKVFFDRFSHWKKLVEKRRKCCFVDCI